MTKTQLIESLEAKRTMLQNEHANALRRGDHFRAQDVVADLRFVCRQLQDALMGR